MNPLSLSVNLWRNLTGSQKVALIFAVVLLGTLVTVSVFYASRPTYVPLYPKLSDVDKAAIVQKLTETKVDYQLTQSTIEVPQDKLDELRMTMASAGIPQASSDGWGLFDKTQFGTSEFTERINQMRAEQGELEKSICTIKTVSSARVHLAMPEHSLYSQEDRPVTASVVLGLTQSTPSGKDIKAIIHLVSSAISGLDAKNVTVVDTNGNLLSEVGEYGLGNGDERLQAQREAETQLETKVQSTLDRVLGPDKSMVRVSARMLFDKSSLDRETFTPSGNTPLTTTSTGTALPPPTTTSAAGTGAPSPTPVGILESEQSTTESYSGARPPSATGIPGVTTNVGLTGSAAGTSAGAGNTGYYRQDKNTSYRISKSVEHIERAPGQIDQIKVALFVDQSIPPIQVSQLPATVAAAAGTTPDMVSVQTISFDTSVAKTAALEQKTQSKRALWNMIAQYGLALILVLGFAGLMLFIYRRSVLAPVNMELVPLEDATQYRVLASPAHAADQYAVSAALPGSEAGTSELQLDPRRVAEVIQSLLKEDA